MEGRRERDLETGKGVRTTGFETEIQIQLKRHENVRTHRCEHVPYVVSLVCLCLVFHFRFRPSSHSSSLPGLSATACFIEDRSNVERIDLAAA